METYSNLPGNNTFFTFIFTKFAETIRKFFLLKEFNNFKIRNPEHSCAYDPLSPKTTEGDEKPFAKEYLKSWRHKLFWKHSRGA